MDPLSDSTPAARRRVGAAPVIQSHILRQQTLRGDVPTGRHTRPNGKRRAPIGSVRSSASAESPESSCAGRERRPSQQLGAAGPRL